MSELINNSAGRIQKLKQLLLKLHEDSSVEEVKRELEEMFGTVPYGEVVQAEQELINEGLPPQEIQKYCDMHSEAIKENVDLSMMKPVPDGHPVHTLRMENRAIEAELANLRNAFIKIKFNRDSVNADEEMMKFRGVFNNLTDIEKHYIKKENILFSYLERYGVTGPSTVMWGKDDEVRGFLKSSLTALADTDNPDAEVLQGLVDLVLAPAADSIGEMITKEEKILFPMCLDRFTEIEWYEINRQCDEVGYCLYAPSVRWIPEGVDIKDENHAEAGKIKLSTGTFTPEELEAMLNSIPVDITFVDKDDKVKFFSHGNKRIFERSKAILGRQVQYCHPPSSVHIVDKILDDFKSGRQDSAKFWINFKGMFVHISYYAVRGANGEYLGTAEITHDITEYKNADGERRLLTYEN